MNQQPPRTRDYIDVLEAIHLTLMPRSYIEIGVENGKSLSLALPGTLIVGIDPAVHLRHPVSGLVQLFRESSDEFFANRTLREVLGGQPLDVAFIDGLHHFDAVLRDFRNLEAESTAESVILIHDCVPTSVRTAQRERETKLWHGDVWKAIVGLRRYRPDLTISVLDLAPTGLALITGLNPTSQILFEKYQDIYDELFPLVLPETDAGRRQLIGPVAAKWSAVLGQLPKRPFRDTSVDQLVSDRARRRPTIESVLWRLRRNVRYSPLGPAALTAARIVRRGRE